MTFLLNITPQLLGMPGSTQDVLVVPEWSLQARCVDKDANSCIFLQQIHDLAKANVRDKKDALAAMHRLFIVMKTGQPLEYFYDKKQCHPAHEFVYAGSVNKIWRIRKNAVRIYFYYAEGKIIYLAAMQTKRKDKLSAAEKTQLESEIKLYLDARSNKTIELVVANREDQ